jgi:hypothetical protein
LVVHVHPLILGIGLVKINPIGSVSATVIIQEEFIPDILETIICIVVMLPITRLRGQVTDLFILISGSISDAIRSVVDEVLSPDGIVVTAPLEPPLTEEPPPPVVGFSLPVVIYTSLIRSVPALAVGEMSAVTIIGGSTDHPSTGYDPIY